MRIFLREPGIMNVSTLWLNDENFFNCSKMHEYSQKISEILASLVLLFVSVVALFANTMMVIVFGSVQKLRKLPNRPLIRLSAFVSVLQCLVYDPMTLYFMSKNNGCYQPPLWMNKFRMTSGWLIFPSGYWLLLALSLVRYFHCHGYGWYFKNRNRVIYGLSGFSMTISCLLIIPGNLDMIRIRYDPRLYTTLFDPNDGFGVQAFMYSFSMELPISLMAYFSLILLRFQSSTMPMTKELKNTVRALIVVYVTSCFVQMPFTTLMFFPDFYLPPTIYPWIVCLGSSRTLLNAYGYAKYCDTFRRAAVMTLRCKRIDDINAALAPQLQIRFVANSALSKSSN